MKYRIKIITYRNGRVEYIPQKRKWFVWAGIWTNGEVSGFGSMWEGRIMNTREDALYIIDTNHEGNATRHTIEFEYITKK